MCTRTGRASSSRAGTCRSPAGKTFRCRRREVYLGLMMLLATALDAFLPYDIVWPTVITLVVVVGSAVIVRVARQSFFGKGRSG